MHPFTIDLIQYHLNQSISLLYALEDKYSSIFIFILKTITPTDIIPDTMVTSEIYDISFLDLDGHTLSLDVEVTAITECFLLLLQSKSPKWPAA